MRHKNLLLILSILFNVLLCIALSLPFVKKIEYKVGLSDKIANDDYWAVKSWGNTINKLIDSCDVVFLGNSITKGSDFRKYFPNKTIVNLGYSGDDILGIANRALHLADINPDKVFIMAGINGSKYESLKAFERRYNLLIENAIKYAPNAEIHIQSILPHCSYKKEYASNEKILKMNGIIKRICSEKSLVYIDLYDLYVKDGELDMTLSKDGVHLYDFAYDRWAEAIRPFIL